MTVKITITNDDPTFRIEAVQLDYNKGERREETGPTTLIEPGAVHTFYIHSFRDLRVKVAHPDLQMRPAPRAALSPNTEETR